MRMQLDYPLLLLLDLRPIRQNCSRSPRPCKCAINVVLTGLTITTPVHLGLRIRGSERLESRGTLRRRLGDSPKGPACTPARSTRAYSRCYSPHPAAATISAEVRRPARSCPELVDSAGPALDSQAGCLLPLLLSANLSQLCLPNLPLSARTNPHPFIVFDVVARHHTSLHSGNTVHALRFAFVTELNRRSASVAPRPRACLGLSGRVACRPDIPKRQSRRRRR